MFELILRLYLILQVCAFVASTPPSCTKLLGQLGEAQKNFITCVTDHSVPITICSTCKEKFSIMRMQYQTLLEDKNCTSYFNHDRLNLIPTTQNLLTSIWSKAYCEECFVEDALTHYTEKYDIYKGCLDEKNTTDRCLQCLNFYKDLNSYFISLDQRYNGKVCFEMQDKMNRTRYQWSKEWKCCQREPKLTNFIVAFILVIGLPLIFYSSSYMITSYRENNHGTLNDEDPLLNMPAPTLSTSSTATPGTTSLLTSSTNLTEATPAVTKKMS
uniref:Osteopetrosis-associated transmembrane protein 1 n=1 Tax=Glossina brevipalpis TaxID=37001 RepID=A0A1A9WC84_9MUSC